MPLKTASLKPTLNWNLHTDKIIHCTQCKRLRSHCSDVALNKRKQFVHQKYWGKPVPAFGCNNAKLVVIGLAPAAHGANRTGRMFTGDKSGEWLYRALFKVGFANQASSTHSGDGLKLFHTLVTAATRCAPPDNKPTNPELENCFPFLLEEVRALNEAVVYLCLGKIAFDQTWKVLKNLKKIDSEKKPKFEHGGMSILPNGKILLMSYHPSQQNTFTGRLTEKMFDTVFETAKLKINGAI